MHTYVYRYFNKKLTTFLLHQINDETTSDNSSASRRQPDLPRIFFTQIQICRIVLLIKKKL